MAAVAMVTKVQHFLSSNRTADPFFNDFFNFYIGGHFENFKNKEHNFE
jgi:hypothetical protein